MASSRRKSVFFSTVMFLFFAVLFLPRAANAYVKNCSTDRFSDGSGSKTLIFPAGGGYNYDAKVSLPINANIGDAKVDLAPNSLIGTPYIWIPNSADNTLAQIRTKDGALIKLYTNSTPGFPATAFSNNSRITLIPGGDVWVANRGNSYVTWLEPVGGGSEEYKYGGQVDIGANLIRGITYDKYGNIWAGTLGSGSDRIRVICTSTTCGGKGIVLATLAGGTSYGMIGDKYGFVWVQTGSGIASYKYSGGSIVMKDSRPLTTPYGIGIDNASNLWVGKHNNWTPGGGVYKITRTLNGSIVGDPAFFASGLNGNGGVAGSGDDKIWAASYGSSQVALFDIAGNHINNFGAGTNAHGIAIDFDNKVWVVNVGGGSPAGIILNPSNCGGSGTVTVYKSDTTYVGTYRTCGNGPYNYSDMTGFRSIPTTMSIGTSEFTPIAGNTYKDFGVALKAALTNCSCLDANGAEQCAVDPSEPDNCLVPLSLFSVTGGTYIAKKLSIACSITYPALTGGLVPCGRLDDNPDTGEIDESKPCSLCALFYTLKKIINFIMGLAIGIGVFILVIAGFLYAFSAGNSRNIELAKSALTSAIIGLTIVFVAWLAIAILLQGLGYANITTWNQVNCALPT